MAKKPDLEKWEVLDLGEDCAYTGSWVGVKCKCGIRKWLPLVRRMVDLGLVAELPLRSPDDLLEWLPHRFRCEVCKRVYQRNGREAKDWKETKQ